MPGIDPLLSVFYEKRVDTPAGIPMEIYGVNPVKETSGLACMDIRACGGFFDLGACGYNIPWEVGAFLEKYGSRDPLLEDPRTTSKILYTPMLLAITLEPRDLPGAVHSIEPDRNTRTVRFRIFVDPEYRRCGIGSALLEALEEIWEPYSLSCEFARNRDGTRAFFENHGYEIIDNTYWLTAIKKR